MHAPSFLTLFVSASGALAVSTCALAPTPKRGPDVVGTCTNVSDTKCVGRDISIWFSPPRGNTGGVLRIRNNDKNIRKIVQVRQDNIATNFWINGGDECVTSNLRMTGINGYSSWYNA
ncbi:uncharacterized protein CTRU02_215086 [Colletotrichum truncatum]|uniref:Uncharacterized protein n=1 Tax=Colletotrichum truncatum TaxID=5467 RepID=A0ACC3YDJ8_COLTU|nr:uncharacterized protein CTRU02_13728 [Colletotrichum truncatum]KAF6783076.1 hypothetical protein CTRU02_13728 [Colletotrichum truncatum]